MESAENRSGAVISHLEALLGPEFSDRLAALLESWHDYGEACLRVEAQLCPVHARTRSHETDHSNAVVGYVDLWSGPCSDAEPTLSIEPESRHAEAIQIPSPAASDNQGAGTPYDDDHISQTARSADQNISVSSKRRKVVGGLRLCASAPRPTNLGNGSKDIALTEKPQNVTRSVRQVHSNNRFPLRYVRKEPSVPLLTPTSADKLIAGIWRQVHAEAEWSRSSLCVDPTMLIHGGMSKEAFRAVNSICLIYHNQSQSSRALEMIVQAYWVDCYEARIAAIQLEQDTLSATDARMTALREACAVLRLTEKDMRNRLAIWRGYKEIKNAGGWASLVFSGSGVYRFCKYRIGFDEGLTQRLGQMRHGLEVAADTLHPEWRQLLGVIGQKSCLQYNGHPHEWVIFVNSPAVPLKSTYHHLKCDMDFRFVDESVIDKAVFDETDPRQMSQIDSTTCPTCQQRQSDDIRENRCSCFPNLFGGVRVRSAVQIFSTETAKNNGVLARSEFPRGTAVGESVGLITDGVEGVDVMLGGSPEKSYQIFQGQLGNFTRFINHSCHPNSQFQKFYWKGMERILVVSRGIQADSEITVDYSDHYWKYLEKPCLCGEACCRYPKTRTAGTS